MNPLVRTAMRLQSRRMARADAQRLAQQTLPLPDIAETRGIPYRPDGGRHVLDVYRPKNAAGPLPVLVDLHGGALLYGDLAVNRSYCNHLARRGFLVVGVEYTLAPQAAFRQQLQELAGALRFIAAHAAGWGGAAAEGFCLTGDSAGGYLALYTAALLGSPALRRAFALPHCTCPVPVRALGLVSPMAHTRNPRPFALMEGELYGPGYKSKPFYPLLAPAALAAACALPPCFILTSEEDFLRAHSLALAEALERSGQPAVLIDLPKGCPERPLVHVFSVGWPDWPESCDGIDRMAAFFRARL